MVPRLMLIELFVIGIAIFVISSLVALEVALLESRRSFLPSFQKDESAARPQVAVADFVVASRLATGILLLLCGGLFGRAWGAYLSLASRDLGSSLPVSARIVHYLAAALLGLLFISSVVVVGYLLPAQVGSRLPEHTMRVLSPVGRLVTFVSWPAMAIGRLLSKLGASSSEKDAAGEEEAIEEDIRTLVEEGERAGVIEEGEKQLISRVFKLGDKPVASLMTPRADVVFLDASMTAGQALGVALEARFGWFPLRNGDDHEVLGIVSAYDLFELAKDGESGGKTLKTVVSSALDVPESMTALELLELFRERGARFAVVRDEYGEVAGIATVDDVLKALVGEMGEPNGESRSVLVREDGSFLVDASSDVENLFEMLSCRTTTDGDKASFHSVGGFVMTSLGHIPKEGDFFLFDGYRFEVVDMDGKRIDKVLVTKFQAKSAVGS
jgi:putative hemolysin